VRIPAGTLRRLAPCVALIVAILGGCASLPPGSSYPKSRSVSLPDPQTTRFGRQFADAAAQNPGRSGFRIFNVGIDGFLLRLEMINAAERTLDLQYYIFRGDESGVLITDALLKAADRGVRVRVLVDEGESVPGDEQLFRLAGHAAIEVRIFNPWRYRGHNKVIRGTEYLLRHSRLDYRMHNKLFVADGSVGLLGGRNIGDQYFQIDPESQFADDDVVAAGPITRELSSEFDEYWNSALAIPAEALEHRKTDDAAASVSSHYRPTQAPKLKSAGLNYADKLATGEPLAGLMSGKLPLVWADAQFVSDAPDKRSLAAAGQRIGDLMYKPVAEMARRVKSELIIVSPYFVPTKDELSLMESHRQHGVRVRALTNSLESNPEVVAHAGYTHYRVELLRDGVQLHEVRSLLGNNRGSGQSARVSRYGNYSLHAKFYVMDASELFIGSMNFDARSRRLNTEMGLIIHNGELAQQEARRFEAMTRPENAYSVELRPIKEGGPPRLVWHTVENGQTVDYDREPARSGWQRMEARFLSLLPLDPEL
jgi:putative cardiolipin synthase